MELVDIVNRNDTVIGSADREIAHKTRQLHRIAAVFVFNSSGQLYVQVHKTSGGLYDHSVGGHVSSGETYAQGAARETKEELGITTPLKEISIFYPEEISDSMHMFGLYACVVEPGWGFTPNDEVEEIIPMDVQTIVTMMDTEPHRFTSGFKATMKEYLRFEAKL